MTYQDDGARTFAKPSSPFTMSILAACCWTASASERETTDANLETVAEIVVTATKRETRLQETALSVSALQGERLESAGKQNVDDYYRAIPGLSVMDSGPQQKKYVIRGIQTDVISGGGTVGFYIDDVPGAGSIDPQLFDVDRVEVLRGPQGTLYGSSSMAGLIRVITNEADLSSFSGRIKARLSSTARGGDNYGISGMANLPIIEDKLAVRLVAYDKRDEGYIDHYYPGQFIPAQPELTLGPGLVVPATPATQVLPIEQRNANDRELQGFRGTLRLQLDRLELGLNVFHESVEVAGAQSDQPTESGPFRNGQSVIQPLELDSSIYNMHGKYDFGTGDFYSTLSYMRTDAHGFQEAINLWPFPFDRFAGPGTALESTVAGRTMTFENRLSLEFADRVSAVVGSFYSRAETSLEQVAARQQDRSNVSLDVYAPNAGTVRELSFFGEASVDVTPKLTLTAGARQSDVEVTAGPVVYRSDSPVFILPRAGSDGSSSSASESTMTFKFSAAYDVSDDLMIYALASEGYRPGGSNQVVPGVEAPPTFKSDSLWNYEVGFKTAWLEERLVANLTAYRVEWQDIQVRDFVNGFGFLGNAGAAHINGIELEAMAQPINRLLLNASASILQAQLDADQPVNPLAPTGNEGRRGERLPGTPELTVAAAVSYDFPITASLDGSVGADWSYTGSSYTRFSDRSPEQRKLGSYSLLNLRAGVLHGRRWSAYLFADNVLDKRADLNIFSSLGSSVVHTPNRPRTIGIELNAQF